MLLIGVALHVDKWRVAAIVFQNTASSTAIFSMQPASRVYTAIIVFPFRYISIFLVSGKREWEEKYRDTSPSTLHFYFIFSKQGALPCLILHKVNSWEREEIIPNHLQ